jgi:hypothetical protein
MHLRKFLYSAVIVISASVYAFIAPHAKMSQPEGTLAPAPKLALLVGINKYKAGSGIRDLRGTHNDVQMMRDLLVDVYKFNQEAPAMKTLLDENATQAAIIASFTQLIAQAKAYKDAAKVDPKNGATVVFFYSGHGSKLEDDGTDELDFIDETIMPHDSNVDREKNKDIRDDQFDVWLRELGQYTSNVTLIFDSCHSGTLSRGGISKSVDRVLSIPKGKRNPDAISIDGMSRNESYVAISGSLPSEESQEDSFPVLDKDGNDLKTVRWNGALTYSLVNLLRRNPDMKYRELMKIVRDKVVAMQKRQTPQAEGDIDRDVFGGADTRGAVPIFVESSKLVKKTIDGKETDVNEITMKAGALVGAGTGATIAVYTKRNGGAREQVASGVVVSATDFKSTAEVVPVAGGSPQVAENAAVFIVSPSFRQKEKRVIAIDFAGGTQPNAVPAEIEKQLKDSALVGVIQQNEILKSFAARDASPAMSWDMAVVRGTYKDFKTGNKQPDLQSVKANSQKASRSGAAAERAPCAQERFSGTEPKEPADGTAGYFLSDRAGNALYNLWYGADDPQAAKCLKDAIETHARIENLRTLSNPESTLQNKFTARLVRLSTFSVAENPFKCTMQPVSPEDQARDEVTPPQMKPDDKFYVEISNKTGKDLYVYLYTLTTSGKISLLYPVRGASAGEKFPSGRTATSLQLLESLIDVPNKAAQSDCAVFYIEPPELSPMGLETLKIIASTEEFPGEIFEQPGLAKSTRGGSLSQMIMQAATGSRNGVMRYKVDEFLTKELSYYIVH